MISHSTDNQLHEPINCLYNRLPTLNYLILRRKIPVLQNYLSIPKLQWCTR